MPSHTTYNQATDIDEVIYIMDEIVRNCRVRESKLGYFAALYRTTTLIVKERCDAGDFFEDNDRMRHLDTVFANRYFEALFARLRGTGKPTQSWAQAFDAADDRNMIIIQHLLMGMNAHISLDLGIATAEVADGEISDSLRRDYYRLNNLLAQLIDVIQDEISVVSPMMRALDWTMWRGDELLIAFSITKARDYALSFAEELVHLPREEWGAAIAARDAEVARINQEIGQARWFMRPVVWLFGHMERREPSEIMKALADDEWQQRIRRSENYVIAEAEARGIDLSKRETHLIPVVRLSGDANRAGKRDLSDE